VNARTLARVLGIVAALVVAAPASAGTVNGTNTFTGASAFDATNWNDAANWSQGEVPDGADDVVIPSGKTVNLVSGASGTAQTLNLAGSLKIDAGSVAGARSLTLGSGTTTLGGILSVFNGAALNLGTTTNWTTSAVGVGGGGGATVNIPASGVLDVTGDVTASNWGGGLWNNQGTINRTTSSGTASFNNAIENDGAINVGSGTLALMQGDGAGTSSGDYTAASGATLKFYGGNYDLTSAASVGGAGTVENYGATVAVGAGAGFNPGALNLGGGGTLQLDTAGTTGSLTATGITRNGSGALTVNGNASVTGTDIFTGDGTTSITGTTSIAATNFNVTNGHTLNLGSTTNWSAGSVGVGGTGGATVDIGAGDVLNITGDVYSGAFGSGLWHNQGTINRTTTTGTATFNNALENDGVVNVSSGTLALQAGDGPGTSSGDYSATGSGMLNFGAGIHELTTGASVTGTGTIRFGGGTTVVGPGVSFDPATLDFYGGELQLNTDGSAGAVTATQGWRSGSGTLTVNGSLSVSSMLTLKGPGTTTVGGTTTLAGLALNVDDGHTLNLGPTTNWSTGIVHVGGTGSPKVNVGAADVVNITGNVNSQGSAGGLWNNQGTINRTTSSGTADFFTPVTSSGTINVDTGTLAFDSGLTQTGGLTEVDAGTVLGGAIALEGGTLKGSGTASGNVTNTGGTVAPGTSPGKLSIGGDYTQSAGTLQVEIAGTGQGTTYDWLAVAGSVTIDGGTLAIVTDPQFAPAASDAFDIVTAGSTAGGGGFSAVTGAQLADKTYDVQTVTGPPGKVRLAFSTPPSSSAAPSVPAGDGHPGDTLTCSPGTWTGAPTSTTFQWLRDGAPIPGATSADYTVTDADVGASIVCRVTATNSGGSTSADSNAVLPTAVPQTHQDPPPPPTHSGTPATPPPLSASSSSTPPPVAPSSEQTVRGDVAFTQGSSNDLYLACTKLDLLLIDVLPAGASKVSVTGTADMRLAGQTTEILLGGKRVGTAVIGSDGSFAAKVPAPPATRRKAARYQARVGATVSQKLKLERRMVATTLTRSGSSLVLRGTVTKPFASKPAAIQVERFLSTPDRNGRFAVRIPAPTGAKAAIYRALTLVPPRPSASASARTFTLPRAIDL
jgi:hypothetical protein